VLAAGLLVAACGQRPEADARSDTAGDRLEAAAVRAGLVVDAARTSLVGSWALDTDRVCIVPAVDDTLRIGALVDYGEGQGCAASGSAKRSGDRVAIRFGACGFDARFDGTRLTFPAELPAACDNLCIGRASLAALTVEHLSASTSEAATLRTPAGRPLCAAATD